MTPPPSEPPRDDADADADEFDGVDLSRAERADIDGMYVRIACANLYELLEVPRSADASALRAAYDRLAARFRRDPARSLGAWGERLDEITRALDDAYALLTNPIRRTGYDATLGPPEYDPGVVALARQASEDNAIAAPAELTITDMLPPAPDEGDEDELATATPIGAVRLVQVDRETAERAAREAVVARWAEHDPRIERSPDVTPSRGVRALDRRELALEEGLTPVPGWVTPPDVAAAAADADATVDRPRDATGWDAALARWSRALRARPDDPVVLERTANAMLRAGADLLTAAAYARRATELAPERLEGYTTLGEICVAAGMTREAAAALEAATRIAPESDAVAALRSLVEG